MARVICGYCSNAGKPVCKECNWIEVKYPTQYKGRKFPSSALKLLNKPVG